MRTILHVDLNNFFASVEILDHPELAPFCVAVCGSVEDRAGIVLAKNMAAKAYGVKTAETIWQAKQKCPQLVIVPPHFDRYMYFSKRAYDIYARYTDQIEPFGCDECWLDVTGSERLFGDGKTIADRIRGDIREELGLTVSIGVSFNKVFAKLGSDLKKPDATTVISRDGFREMLWPLPSNELLWVGRATQKKLDRYSINTIGKIAEQEPEFLQRLLGVGGITLWRNANGMDTSPVHRQDWRREIKSIGNSTTTVRDLTTSEEVNRVMLELSTSVSRRLRKEHLEAMAVQITVKDSTLAYQEYQCPLEVPTRSSAQIVKAAMQLFLQHYSWRLNVRAVGVRAIKLVPENSCQQASFYYNLAEQMKHERLEAAVDKLGERYGKGTVRPASLLIPLYMSPSHEQPFGMG